jgi:hypothetical protein
MGKGSVTGHYRCSEIARLAALGVVLGIGWPNCALAQSETHSAAPMRARPTVGTIKAIAGNLITLVPDSGADVKITVPAEAKILRVPPGSKDLKEATPIQFSDLQEGDRILVRGAAGSEGSSFVATSVIAMKKGEIAEKQSHEIAEWQRRGIGGLVKNVDASAGVVTIGMTTAAEAKDITIRVGKATVVRRYAQDSVKFDDANPAALTEIKAGDQVRARGTKSADGSEFAADEIVSGTFRNISGPIVGVEPETGMVTVADLATRKNVEVKITAESQLRKFPENMARRMAMRLKGTVGEGNGNSGGVPGGARSASASGGTAGAGPGGGEPTGGTGGGGRGGGGDFQQLLSHLPASTLADFQKGDAVMVVATEGKKDGAATAITFLGGVEPILQAAPEGQASSILTPWSLNSGGADPGTP